MPRKGRGSNVNALAINLIEGVLCVIQCRVIRGKSFAGILRFVLRAIDGRHRTGCTLAKTAATQYISDAVGQEHPTGNSGHR